MPRGRTLPVVSRSSWTRSGTSWGCICRRRIECSCRALMRSRRSRRSTVSNQSVVRSGGITLKSCRFVNVPAQLGFERSRRTRTEPIIPGFGLATGARRLTDGVLTRIGDDELVYKAREEIARAELLRAANEALAEGRHEEGIRLLDDAIMATSDPDVRARLESELRRIESRHER